MPLGRGEPLVLPSSVELVAFLALVLRERARCTRRLTCVTRTGHSLLSVLPLEKLREPANLFRRLRELGRSTAGEQRRGSHALGALRRPLSFLGATWRRSSRVVVARRGLASVVDHVARLAASTPLSDSECCESANK